MSVERLLAERAVDRELVGAPISRRSRQTARSLDAYLRAGGRPRWMERLSEIEGRTAMEKRRLERVYHTLEEEYGRGTALFAGRWRAFARAVPLRRHQRADPPAQRLVPDRARPGDGPAHARLRADHGRSYRRTELGPEWILEHFPASPADAD